MMIYKYPLPVIPGSHEVVMKKGAFFLSLQMQDGVPTMWCAVEPNEVNIRARIRAVYTGQHVDLELEPEGQHKDSFIGTVQLDNGLVIHYFDVGED